MPYGGGYAGGGGGHGPPTSRIYVGNLPSDIRERELDDLFGKYGRIRSLDIKGGAGRPFAFIEFTDPRDAEDAIYYREGYEFAGRPLRVERTKGRGGPGPSERGVGSYGGRHSEHRIFVEPIPKGGSWQDLKDFARAGGFNDVLFADVQGDVGTLEFGNGDDVDRAVQALNDTKFRTRFDETGIVTVRKDGGGGGGGGRRSPSPRRDDRRSRSRSRDRDDDRRDDDRRDDDRRDDDRRDDDRRSGEPQDDRRDDRDDDRRD
eukprot:m.88511 g.88511  ORF g.88511 m.88511 type:complete len:261 (+) comp11652_c0_seq3:56-838(+)